MTRRVPPLIVGWTLLLVSWGCSDDLIGPGSEPFCGSRQDSAVVTFEDANLELAIRSELSVSPLLDLTCGMVGAMTSLRAAGAGIASLEGIQNLTSLTNLWIRANAITDVSPLRGLTSLTSLNLAANAINDIGPLSGLDGLTFLAINENGSISDIGALSGLSSLTGSLWIAGNSITDLAPLSQLTGVTTLNAWDNTITDISGLSGLTGLTELRLHINSITDVSALGGLSRLNLLWLAANPNLSDIQPLLDNPALGAGVNINLEGTSVSCSAVAALLAKGASVISDCP